MHKVQDRTKAAYDRIAAEYARTFFDFSLMSKQYDKFKSLCSKGSLILDIGCGPGRDVKYFSDNGYKVVGIEYSAGMLAQARRMVPEADFREMDMRRLGFKNGSFDAVWANASLHHLPKDQAETAVKEMARVLKRGGIVYLSVINGPGKDAHEINEDGRQFFSYRLEELEKLLDKNGLKMVDGYVTEGFGGDWVEVFARKV